MTYPELAELDSTPDQDLGLTIAYKLAVNALPENTIPFASPGAYLAARVQELLKGYARQHVTNVQELRVQQVVKTNVQAAAATLGVDLTVLVPADKVVE